MGPFGWLTAGRALVVTGLVLSVAAFAGVVRLLPWLVSPEVPLEVSAPFAKALLRAALEAAILVGPAAGFAYAGAEIVDSGQARALFALGAAPHRLALGAIPSSLGVVAVAVAIAWLVGFNPVEPGRFAAQLVDEGRESCAGVERPRSVEVPMAGITWLCFPGQPPRVVGEVPRSRGRAWFTATGIELGDDLSTISVRGLELRARGDERISQVRVSADEAHVSGLTPWGSTARSPWRSALPFLIAVVLGPLGLGLVLRFGIQSRWLAGAIGGGAGVAALGGLGLPDWALWGPLFAALVLGLAAGALRSVNHGLVARRRAR